MADIPIYEGILLGQETPVRELYAPDVLYPIPRAISREQLGLARKLYGVDLWHAYEMSWLDGHGKPVVRVGRFSVPASSPNMVESKSFKLYLNSLNNVSFDDDASAVATIMDDLRQVVGEAVTLELLQPDDPSLAGSVLDGECLDTLEVSPVSGEQPAPELLQIRNENDVVEERLYSHLLRSLCPVTGQPDWATLWCHYRGKPFVRSSLLRYIIAFRNHQEFHEQCVERIFRDMANCCDAEFLHVQGFYTRRGGLDINPFRSTDPSARPLPRLNRQ